MHHTPDIINTSTSRGAIRLEAWEGLHQLGCADTYVQGNTAIIEKLLVKKPYRKNGIGTLMLEQTEDLSRAQGAKRILMAASYCEAGSPVAWVQTLRHFTRHGYRNFGFVLAKKL